MGKRRTVESLADLTPDPRNARRHTERNVGMIRDALAEVGAARSIVIDERGVILAGNATAKAATEAGLKLHVVDADGDAVVAVRRSNLTAKQKARLALFDNRAAEEAEWDVDVLSGLKDDGLLDGMWSSEELDALLAVPEIIEPGDGGDDFDCTPEDGPTRCQPGDLWLLGKHRLLCGDSTKAEDVERVLDNCTVDAVLTDPPYGTASMSKVQKRGDEIRVFSIDWDEAAPLGWISHAARVLAPGGAVVSFWDNKGVTELWRALEEAEINPLQLVYWVKPVCPQPRQNFCSTVESAVFGRKGGGVRCWNGGGATPNNYSCARSMGGERTTHETQKPLALWAWILALVSESGHGVYDPFLGSGTTLIAAERLGRRCYGIEISPKYCDVILRRWEAETGGTAERVG